MTEFKIEKGVPMKPRVRYPFDKMEVGDSFFVAGQTADSKKRNAQAATAARVRGRYHADKFAARTVTENGVKGVRIWRVK